MDEKEAIAVLKKYSSEKRIFDIVLRHSLAVKELALEFAVKHPNADKDFIVSACILHDIGRFECPPGPKTIFHGVVGARILRKEGLRKLALVAERHLGAGIGKEDIRKQNLPLPYKDFLPISIEEKIITLADSLIEGDKRISLSKAAKRFEKEVNKSVADRLVKLYDEVCKRKGYK
jgi:uncharacterized protein